MLNRAYMFKWKVAYGHVVAVTERVNHIDNQHEVLCRDEGSEELKPSDSSLSSHTMYICVLSRHVKNSLQSRIACNSYLL
jgi:hypothetical protein